MQRLWQRMRQGRVVVLGRVGMDLYADPPGTRIEEAARYVSAIGGSAGNIAAALGRQGVPVALLSCVAEDAVGRFCLAELARYGVETGHVRAVGDGARASLAVVETRPEDAQTVLYRNGAADLALTAADVAAVDFTRASALIVTGTALSRDPSRRAAGAAMVAARSAGAVVVLDVDWRPQSWASAAEAAEVCLAAARAADVVVGNDTEFGLLAGDEGRGAALARDLAQCGALFTVYKRGAAGCTTHTADYSFATGIFPVSARKPMGSGDGFMGGLIAGLASGQTLEAAVRRGAATAAMIVAGIGCAPASPTCAELDAFISRF